MNICIKKKIDQITWKMKESPLPDTKWRAWWWYNNISKNCSSSCARVSQKSVFAFQTCLSNIWRQTNTIRMYKVRSWRTVCPGALPGRILMSFREQIPKEPPALAPNTAETSYWEWRYIFIGPLFRCLLVTLEFVWISNLLFAFRGKELADWRL